MDSSHYPKSSNFSLKQSGIEHLLKSPYIQYLISLPCGSTRKFYNDSSLLTDRLLDSISLILNNFHSTNYSRRYWQVRLYPWLPTLSSYVLDKSRYLSHISSCDSDLYMKMSQSPPSYLTYNYFSYSEQIQSLAYSDGFNDSILSDLIYFLKANTIYDFIPRIQSTFRRDHHVVPSRFIERICNLVVNKSFSLVSFFLAPLFGKRQYVLFSSDYRSYFRLPNNILYYLFRSQIYVPPRANSSISSSHVDLLRLQKIIDSFLKNSSFDITCLHSFVLNILPLIIPSEFLDISLLPSKFPEIINKTLFTATSLWGCPYSRAYFAAASARPSNLLCTIEHGGSIPVAFEQSKIETEFSDFRFVPYRTFNAKHRRSRLSISSTYNFSKFNRASLSSRFIRTLFILPAFQSFIFRSSSQYTPLDALNIFDYILSHIPIDSLSYSVRIPSNVDHINSQIYKLMASRFYICDQPSISSAISNNDISIVFYPETCVLDCVKSGKPFLVYSPPSYEFQPYFSSLITNLRLSNLLFFDLSDLFEFLDSISSRDALNLWWSSNSTQSCLTQLVDECF